MIPVYKPYFNKNEETAVLQCVRDNEVSQGKNIGAFCNNLEIMSGLHVSLCNSGTSACQLMLKSFGIGPGDEVICPSITFVATYEAILNCGATPVICPVSPSGLLDFTKIHSKINKNTKAIMPVSLYGQLDFEGLHYSDIPILLDACESFAPNIYEQIKKIGAQAAAVSFFANKNITTGEGGTVFFRDVYKKSLMNRLIGHGRCNAPVMIGRYNDNYYHDIPSSNFRMTNMQAALGVEQLKKLPEIIDIKQDIFSRYKGVCTGSSNIQMMPYDVPWLATFQINPNTRQRLEELLITNNIDFRPSFHPAQHLPPYMKYCTEFDYNAENIYNTWINLPSYPGLLDTEDFDTIINVIEYLR